MRLQSDVLEPAAAAASASAPASEVAQLLAAGRLNKTALNKLKLATLREECTAAGLVGDGKKDELVARLLEWAKHRQQLQGQQQEHENEAAGDVSREATEAVSEQQLQQQQEAQRHEEEAALASDADPGGSTALASRKQQQQQQQQQQRPARGGPRPRSDVSVTWLGTSSGNPTARRNVSSIAVRMGDDLFLVDAGEGTHNQLLRAGLDPGAISRIFITHMHGDHCFGLPGLLAAICQARLGGERQGQAVHVYGPPEVQALLLAACRTAHLRLTTPVVAVAWALDAARAAPPRRVDPAGALQFGVQGPDQGPLPRAAAAELEAAYDAGEGLAVVREGLSWSLRLPGGIKVAAAQLSHRVPCWGYVFVEPTRVLEAPPPGAEAMVGGGGVGSGGGGGQQQGQEWVRRGRKLVILGDTCDSRAIASLARGCDLLSHEATFMRGMEDKAEIATHSTAEQAGAFARRVAARALVLTHFSARYDVPGARIPVPRRNDPRGGAGGRAQQQKQRRGGGGDDGAGAIDAGPSEQQEAGQMQQLLSEAAAGFQSDSIHLAFDGFTFAVPPRPPQAASPRPDGWRQRQAAQLRGARGHAGGRQLAARGQQQRQQWQQQRGQQVGGQQLQQR